jgi:hypothetical protein
MKKAIFSFAMILVTLTGFSQLTLPQVGLPVEVDALKNCVINSVVHTQPQISVSRTGVERVTFRTLTPGVTAYGLNFIHSYLHEYGHDFVSATNGTYIFFKPSIKFNQNGKDYHIAAQELNVYQEATGRWVFKVKSYTKSFRLRAGRVWKDYSDEQLAALAGVTVEQLHERLSSYYYGFERNPATHMTNTFALVEQSGNSYTAKLYVNLVETPVSAYNQKFTSYNKKNSISKFQWLTYNDCTAATASPSVGYSAGNFGLCAINVTSPTTPFTPTFDLTREYATLEGQFVESAGGGKEYITHCYFVVKGCDIDDPCGQAQRLPRKPVQ